MSKIAINTEISGSVEEACQKVTESIRPFGFGILTRIDFDKKVKEKLGEEIAPCVILGACNPRLALEAYRLSTDTALLIPCNIAVSDIGNGRVRIEAMRPSQMLKMLPGLEKSDAIIAAERDLEKAIMGL